MRTLLTSILLLASGWTAAQVLTAEEAVRIAVEQNHGIRLARLDARSAELLNTPGNAGMLPTVDAVGQYGIDNSATKQTFFSGDVREADNADQRVLDAAVQLNWTVFDGLAMFAAKDRLETLELIGRTQLRQRIEATTYEVLATYFQLVQLRKAIAVQREGVRISRERLRITETGARIGSASGLNLVQARLDLSTDSAAVLDLQVQEAVTTTRLNALMGRDPSTTVEVASEVPPTEALDLAQVQQAARQANSAVQQARQQRIAADLSLKELRGTLLPQVDLFANYGYTKSTSAVGILQSNQALGPDYGARVSIPLFRGLQLRSAKEVAELMREQAAITTQQAELDLEESLLNAWTSYTTANQRVALEEQNLTGARTQSDVALESYRIGSLSSVELRDVQLGLVAAEQRLLVAKYEAKLAELQLKWLSGATP
ncbi:MAG: TolC family protein [Flavobacteriales bacterium]|nr:TolC family protein [Flavobacteriales bacterium]